MSSYERLTGDVAEALAGLGFQYENHTQGAVYYRHERYGVDVSVSWPVPPEAAESRQPAASTNEGAPRGHEEAKVGAGPERPSPFDRIPEALLDLHDAEVLLKCEALTWPENVDYLLEAIRRGLAESPLRRQLAYREWLGMHEHTPS